MFFTQLAELLDDRQELRITVKKVEGDLVTITNTDFKNKGEAIHITGTPAELDEAYMNEIKKPIEISKATFQSNADEVAGKIQEEKKDESKNHDNGSKKLTSKKKPVKSAVKKSETKNKKRPAKKAEQLELKPDVTEEFDKMMAMAKEAMDDKKYTTAKEYLETALTLNPDDETCKSELELVNNQIDFDAHVVSGKQFMEKKEFQNAVDSFTKAFNIFNDNEEINSLLGTARKKLDAYNLLNDELV